MGENCSRTVVISDPDKYLKVIQFLDGEIPYFEKKEFMETIHDEKLSKANYNSINHDKDYGFEHIRLIKENALFNLGGKEQVFKTNNPYAMIGVDEIGSTWIHSPLEAESVKYMNKYSPEASDTISRLKRFERDQDYEIQGDPPILGPFKYKDGKTYLGQLRVGIREGFGEDISLNGSGYLGYWKDGHQHGKGRVTFSNGNLYEGEFELGRPHGSGYSLNKELMVTYEGEWREGIKHGIGKETFADGTFYQGNFVNGMRDGLGTFSFSDGSIYIGDFKKGIIEGNGKYTYTDGKIYEGQFRSNRRSGEGTLRLKDGSRYKGMFENGKFHGTGKFEWYSLSINYRLDGRYYTGQWAHGMQFGKGMLQEAKNGAKVVGFWKEGRLIRSIKQEEEI